MRFFWAAFDILVGAMKFGLPAYIAVELLWRDGPRLQTELVVHGFTLLGGYLGYRRWQEDATPTAPPDVHGSASFGHETLARSSLGGANGLIV